MKLFYRCKECGAEFCLKGRKYIEEGGDMICSGQPNRGGKHPPVKMEVAGDTIEDLRVLRTKHKTQNAAAKNVARTDSIEKFDSKGF